MILAHGVGGRADLPLPVWLFAYSAAFALILSFVALRILWPRPRLAAAAGGRAAPVVLDRVTNRSVVAVQAVVLVLFVVALAAAWFGVDSVAQNLAPTAVYVVFWIGMQVISALFGDVWRRANPLWIIAAGFDRIAGRDPERSTATGVWAGHWPAAAGLAVFVWLELAYHEPGSTAAVGTFLGVYSAAVLVGAARFGAGWVRNGDGFAVLFTLLASLASFHRDEAGRLRLRWPGTGLAEVAPRPGTLVVVLVLLGSTAFDGFSRTEMWGDVLDDRRGWEATLVNTFGLGWAICVVAALFFVACRFLSVMANDELVDPGEQARRWVPSLIPIMLAYAVAHYFSLLVFEGQAFVAQLSDPFGEGWDLFGTAGQIVDYTVISPNTIAYVQVAAIVVGHVAGVIAAHDRAVELYPERIAVRSQYPMLAAMVAYTVGGLLLLLNA